MIRARHTETLVDYDGPQVFVAEDAVGTRLLCVLVSESAESNRYLAVAISSQRLSALKASVIDLREIFAKPERTDWYLIECAGTPNGHLRLLPQGEQPIREDWLPEPGFFLAAPSGAPATPVRPSSPATPNDPAAAVATIDQSIEALRLMQNALLHLKNDVLPKNPRMFAVMAEGPLAEIEKLRDEIEEKTRGLAGVS